MTDVRMSSQLTGSSKLYRYLSLDKLLDLLSTEELFFAPLASFVKSDPYEGYLPAVAMEADSGIYRPVIEDIESAGSAVEEHRRQIGQELTEEEKNNWQSVLASIKTAPARFFQAINQCIAVNCWHMNDTDSEAMWRLYGDGGKVVAVETCVDGLRES